MLLLLIMTPKLFDLALEEREDFFTLVDAGLEVVGAEVGCWSGAGVWFINESNVKFSANSCSFL